MPTDAPKFDTPVPQAPRQSRPATSRTALFGILALILIALFVWTIHRHPQIYWQQLHQQLNAVSWTRVCTGIALIYFCFVLRAARWAVLLAPMRKSTMLQLLPAQILGFTGVAIFGRVADLARPYLIARRTSTPVTTQIAIYSIERTFDLAAAATLFSVALAFAPSSTPHHRLFVRAGMTSLAGTALLAATAIVIRLRGETLASRIDHLLQPFSTSIATKVAARILDLQQGFGAISSVLEFTAAMSLSLLMWAGIAGSYLMGTTAFRATPQLADFSISATMLLMAAGMGGSILQLPVLGWFTQIALFATTMHALFGVPIDTASACAATIFTITNLSVIPGGLLTAQFEGIGLRDAVIHREAL